MGVWVPKFILLTGPLYDMILERALNFLPSRQEIREEDHVQNPTDLNPDEWKEGELNFLGHFYK